MLRGTRIDAVPVESGGAKECCAALKSSYRQTRRGRWLSNQAMHKHTLWRHVRSFPQALNTFGRLESLRLFSVLKSVRSDNASVGTTPRQRPRLKDARLDSDVALESTEGEGLNSGTPKERKKWRPMRNRDLQKRRAPGQISAIEPTNGGPERLVETALRTRNGFQDGVHTVEAPVVKETPPTPLPTPEPKPKPTAKSRKAPVPPPEPSVKPKSAPPPVAAKDASDEEEQIVVDDDISNVCLVHSVAEAQRVMSVLRSCLEAKPDRIFACDTEVMDIDIKKESPRGHGAVICFTVYCGDDVDFSPEPSANAPLTHLWVDTLGQRDEDRAEVQEVAEVFKEFFEDEKFKKVWHNYGFDRHVLTNADVHCQGFGGDTMHMARLWDSSRTFKGYTLESLSTARELGLGGGSFKKVSMKKLFGEPKLKKDGTVGKILLERPVEEIQRDASVRDRWIYYAARDARATFEIYHRLKEQLQSETYSLCYMDSAVHRCYPHVKTLWDFYVAVWQPFGELLTDMEDAGFLVDAKHLREAQIQAESDREAASRQFRSWADSIMDGASHMNLSSDAQIRTMLFAGVKNKKTKAEVEHVRVIKVPNPEYELHIQEGRTGRKPRKMVDAKVHGLWGEGKPCPFKPQIFTAAGWPAVSAAALKSLVGKPGVAGALLEERYGESGKGGTSELQQYDSPGWDEEEGGSLTELEQAYNRNYEAAESGLGPLYSAFQSDKEGLSACAAIEALVDISAIDTLLSSFILPLQGDHIKAEDGRIHCSMNINTETGRLSCRKPNLQNQPSLEKDRYKVRQSFKAAEGKTLVVADYGQLELRILAHLTQCHSMLEAFQKGGDFHSRTAAGMYDHIQQGIAEGKVALEKGTEHDDIPLVKDVYASERRKAKVLNFSIAYGKTPHGLAKDWGVGMAEAEETLERWYSDRQEVRRWQNATIQNAEMSGYVTTLLGRRRNLPDLRAKSAASRSHAGRAAINTPIQGSAADIVTAAMLRIAADEKLRSLGYRLLSQVHDEVILEGPKESAEEAKQLVIQCMAAPFPASNGDGYCNPLGVELTVDCNFADTWYDAK